MRFASNAARLRTLLVCYAATSCGALLTSLRPSSATAAAAASAVGARRGAAARTSSANMIGSTDYLGQHAGAAYGRPLDRINIGPASKLVVRIGPPRQLVLVPTVRRGKS